LPPGDPGRAYDVKVASVGDNGLQCAAPLIVLDVAASETVDAPANFDVNPVSITSGGAVMPALAVSADDSTNARVSEFIVELRETGAQVWRQHHTGPASNTTVELRGVAPDQAYDVRGFFRTVRGALSAPTATVQVTAPNQLVSTDTANLNGTPAADVLSGISDNVDAVDALADDVDVIAAGRAGNLISDPEFANGTDAWRPVTLTDAVTLIATGTPRAVRVSGDGDNGLDVDWPGGWTIEAGGVVDASLEVVAFSGGVSLVDLEVRWFDAAGDYLSTTPAASADAATGRVGGVVAAPAGTASFRVRSGVTASAGARHVTFTRPQVRIGEPGQTTASAFVLPDTDIISQVGELHRAIAGAALRMGLVESRGSDGRARVATLETARTSDGLAIAGRFQLVEAGLGDHEARVSIAETAVVELEGRTAARVVITATVDDVPAQVEFLAEYGEGGVTTALNLVATGIALRNLVGGEVVDALIIEGGVPTAPNGLLIGSQTFHRPNGVTIIRFGNARMRAFGPPFGPDNLIDWNGPEQANETTCTILNGKRSEDADGVVYLAGAAQGASDVEASGQQTSTAGPTLVAAISHGPSNGNDVHVSWGLQFAAAGVADADNAGVATISLQLWRRVDTGGGFGSWAQVGATEAVAITRVTMAETEWEQGSHTFPEPTGNYNWSELGAETFAYVDTGLSSGHVAEYESRMTARTGIVGTGVTLQTNTIGSLEAGA